MCFKPLWKKGETAKNDDYTFENIVLKGEIAQNYAFSTLFINDIFI